MQGVITPSLGIADHKVDESPFTPDAGPLFVVGMFRSGTSLLYALLNQHSDIALMYEGDLPHLHSMFWLPRDTAQWMARWSFWNGALPRHKLDTTKIPAGIHDLSTAVRAVHMEYARQKKKGASIWGCKSPTYYDEITRLSRTFPSARFVIIWRDLTSICRSVAAASEDNVFFRRKGTLLRVLLGYHEMKMQCDALVAEGGTVHQLYYEDLVRDPVAAMKQICEFLQIPFEPTMTNLEGADRSAIQEGSHHSQVKGKQIASRKLDPSVLSPVFKRKIERYIHLWRRQYAGWPLYPKSLEDTVGDPSAGEKVRDRVVYRMLSLWHHTTPIVFSFVPLSVWRAYRRFIDAWRYSRLPQGTGARVD